MKSSLTHLLNPGSVAVLGASDDPLKPGGRVIDYMRRAAYSGTIYPITKSKRQVQGVPAFQALEELPAAPDLVVVALPETLVDDALRSAVALGARGAIVYASGYAELGDHGQARQAEIARIARNGGLRLVGPNTQGVANFATGAIAHFGTIIDQLSPPVSPIGIVSQSGAGSQILYARLAELGLGARYLVATGNEADVDVADMVEAFVEDAGVELVLVYAESLKNPRKLAQAALKARDRGLPVLMVKAGRTRSGQQTAASHTGALASEDRLVDVFLEKYGVLRAADLEELAQLSQLFLAQRGHPGKRLTVVSNSGATCVMAADATEEYGLQLGSFDDDFKRRLSEVLPPYIAPGNPIDMTTASLKQPDLFEQILGRLEQADNTDMVLAGFPVGGKGYDFPRYARELRAFSDRAACPVAVSVNQEWTAEIFRRERIPVFSSERRAVAALAQLARYHDRRSRTPGALPDALSARAAFPYEPRIHNELDSLSLLADAGLPVVSYRVCASAQEAADAWRAMQQGPVVLKGISDQIHHKSEHGLVHVGLTTEGAIRDAADTLLRQLRVLGETDPRLLLAPFVPADFELMAGAQVDGQLGPMVAVGLGGVLVEALEDIRFIPAPLTHGEALEHLSRLHIAPAFGALRGMAAVDLAAIAEILVNLGQLVTQPGNRIRSIDINPIRVQRGDARPVIVDALVVQAQEALA